MPVHRGVGVYSTATHGAVIRCSGFLRLVGQDDLMTFSATAIRVLVASPGDTAEERTAIQHQLGTWNATRGEREGVVVVPWLFEQHSVPMLGGHAQSVINGQAVDRADVVVAFFDSRLGTETPGAVSGTAEEIKRAHAAGKPVHVYFSNEPLPRTVDAEQLSKLQQFKVSLQAEGLLGTYESPEHLANQVATAIDFDVSTQSWSPSPRGAAILSGANLTARHDYEREMILGSTGKSRAKTRSYLVISNSGDATASDVQISLEADEDQFARWSDPEPFELTRNSELEFGLIAARSGNVRVKMAWTESGESKEASQTIRVRAS